jgi:hypothetical protein
MNHHRRAPRRRGCTHCRFANPQRIDPTKTLAGVWSIILRSAKASWFHPAASAYSSPSRRSKTPAPVMRNAGADRELAMMRWACRLRRAPLDQPGVGASRKLLRNPDEVFDEHDRSIHFVDTGHKHEMSMQRRDCAATPSVFHTFGHRPACAMPISPTWSGHAGAQGL